MQPHPWFNPPIRRHLTTLFCAGWVAFELFSRPMQGVWVMIAAAGLAWCVWDLYLAGHYPVVEAKPGDEAGKGSE